MAGCIIVRSRGALDGGAANVEFTAVMDHKDEDLEDPRSMFQTDRK